VNSPSRRTLLHWLGLLSPLLAADLAMGVSGKASAHPWQQMDPGRRAAIAGLADWLSRQGVTLGSLARLDGATGSGTEDLCKSFSADPLISVDGFMLPTGFCRYCLAIGAQMRVA
jgi:hypothetical protein